MNKWTPFLYGSKIRSLRLWYISIHELLEVFLDKESALGSSKFGQGMIFFYG